jgi:hypothetical protein
MAFAIPFILVRIHLAARLHFMQTGRYHHPPVRWERPQFRFCINAQGITRSSFLCNSFLSLPYRHSLVQLKYKVSYFITSFYFHYFVHTVLAFSSVVTSFVSIQYCFPRLCSSERLGCLASVEFSRLVTYNDLKQ